MRQYEKIVGLLLLSLCAVPGFCATPQRAEARRHFKRSVGLWEKSDGEGEIAELRKTLALDPGFQEAHFNLAVALADKNEFGEAATEFREAVRLKPSDDLAHHCLALVLEKQGELSSALEESKVACELDPKNGTYKAHYEQMLRIIHALPGIQQQSKEPAPESGLGTSSGSKLLLCLTEGELLQLDSLADNAFDPLVERVARTCFAGPRPWGTVGEKSRRP